MALGPWTTAGPVLVAAWWRFEGKRRYQYRQPPAAKQVAGLEEMTRCQQENTELSLRSKRAAWRPSTDPTAKLPLPFKLWQIVDALGKPKRSSPLKIHVHSYRQTQHTYFSLKSRMWLTPKALLFRSPQPLGDRYSIVFIHSLKKVVTQRGLSLSQAHNG